MGADELDALERPPRLRLGRGDDLEVELHRDTGEAGHGVGLHRGTAHVEERDAGHAVEAAAAEDEGRGLGDEAEKVRQAATEDVEGLGEHGGHAALRAKQGGAQPQPEGRALWDEHAQRRVARCRLEGEGAVPVPAGEDAHHVSRGVDRLDPQEIARVAMDQALAQRGAVAIVRARVTVDVVDLHRELRVVVGAPGDLRHSDGRRLAAEDESDGHAARHRVDRGGGHVRQQALGARQALRCKGEDARRAEREEGRVEPEAGALPVDAQPAEARLQAAVLEDDRARDGARVAVGVERRGQVPLRRALVVRVVDEVGVHEAERDLPAEIRVRALLLRHQSVARVVAEAVEDGHLHVDGLVRRGGRHLGERVLPRGLVEAHGRLDGRGRQLGGRVHGARLESEAHLRRRTGHHAQGPAGGVAEAASVEGGRGDHELARSRLVEAHVLQTRRAVERCHR